MASVHMLHVVFFVLVVGTSASLWAVLSGGPADMDTYDMIAVYAGLQVVMYISADGDEGGRRE